MTNPTIPNWAFVGLSISPLYLETFVRSAPGDLVSGTTALFYRRGGRDTRRSGYATGHCTNINQRAISNVSTILGFCRSHEIVFPAQGVNHTPYNQPVEEQIIIPCAPSGASKGCENPSNTRAICRLLSGVANTDLTFTLTAINLSPVQNTGGNPNPNSCGSPSCIFDRYTVPVTITCPAVI